MYLPKRFRQDEVAEMHALIEATRLTTLVTVADGAPLVSHVPVLFDPARGDHGTIICHLARANPQARALVEGQEVLSIFLGPSAYVSPSWYESKREHGKVVPTWNYLAVHATGAAHLVSDAPGIHAIVDMLTQHHERPRAERWAVDDAPADYIASEIRGIVGLEIAVTRMDGKWKLGQDEPAADAAGAATGLATGDAEDAAIAAAIRRSRRNAPP